MKRLRVLISAYACEPGKGSESGTGWNIATQVARHHAVWVITRANNRPSIAPFVSAGNLPPIHWIYFDLPRWAAFWKRGGRGVYLYYLLWQIGAYLLVRRLHRQQRFDVVHHVTFTNYWQPCLLPWLSTPFVIGPAAGGETAPGPFKADFSRKGQLLETIREAALWLASNSPLQRATVGQACYALSITDQTGARLRALGCSRVNVVGPPIGLTPDELAQLGMASLEPARQHAARFISIGRLVHWKGFHLGIRAFARHLQGFPESEYWILGDGPEHASLARLATQLGIVDRIRFLGYVPREEEFRLLAACDALLHPSLHDPGAWVCVEALAAGRPVLCLDADGPAQIVTDECGWKVPAFTPQQVVTDLTVAMAKLVEDPGCRRQMGEAGRRRVHAHFTWEKQNEPILNVYEQCATGSFPA
jgi:glycosyltransferase involved in cell wall biosynthesis